MRFTFHKFKPPPGMNILHDYFMGTTAEKLPSKLATEVGSSAYPGAARLGARRSGMRRAEKVGCGFEAAGDQGEHVSSRKSQNWYTFNSMTMSGIGKKVFPIPAQRDSHAGLVPA